MSTQSTLQTSAQPSTDLVSVIENARFPSHTWQSAIPIEVYDTAHPNIPDVDWFDPTKPTDLPILQDITATLGGQKRGGNADKHSYLVGAFYLPPAFNSDDDACTSKVDNYVTLTCARARVEVIANGTSSVSKNEDNNLLQRYFICRLGRKSQDSRGKSLKRKDTTTRPDQDHVCKFKFRVLYDPTSLRWFLPRKQLCTPHHQYHHQVESIDSIHFPTRLIEKDDLRVIMQLIALRQEATQIARWFKLNKGFQVSKSQIQKLITTFRQGRYYDPTTAGFKGPKANSIDALLQSIQTDDRMTAIWMTSTKETAESSITVKTTKKRRSHDEAVLAARLSNPSTENLETAAFAPVGTSSDTETPQTYTETILKSLQIASADNFLLALAWADKDAILELASFPFVLGMDETEKTNCEDRPLFCLVGLNRDNNIIPVAHIFMPSKARWAYHWIYTQAIPFLLPQEIRRHVSIVITDQGTELVQQLAIAIDLKVFPSAKHRLCLWHIVNRNFHMKAIRYVREQAALTLVDNNFIDVIDKWLYSFGYIIETAVQEQSHLNQLKQFITTSGKVAPSLVKFALEFVCDKFEPILPKICKRHFMQLNFGDTRVSSFVESHNGVLTTSPTGPRPNQPLTSAHRNIQGDNRMKLEDRRAKLQRDLGRTLTKKTCGPDTNPWKVIQNHSSAVLSTHLSPKTLHLVQIEWVRAGECVCLPVESTKKYKIVFPSTPMTITHAFLVCRHPELDISTDDLVPSYRNGRVVQLGVYGGEKFLRCSCFLFNRTGCPCRHVLALLPGLPTVSYFSPDCLKVFGLRYGRDKTFSVGIDKYRSSVPAGTVCVGINSVGGRNSTGAWVDFWDSDYKSMVEYVLPSLPTKSGKAILKRGAVSYAVEHTLKHDNPLVPKDTNLRLSSSTVGPPELLSTWESPEVDVLTYEVDELPKLTSTPVKLKSPPVYKHDQQIGESLLDYKSRLRNECASSFLKILNTAKTANELRFVLQHNKHLKLSIDMKHAAEDVYGTIAANRGGTLSGAIPLRGSPNKRRLRMMNEPPAKKK